VQLNTTLTTLELNGNVIDYDGAVALASALTENESLTTLTIRCACDPDLSLKMIPLPPSISGVLATRISPWFLTEMIL
jgi:Leucine Rich repeat